MQAQRSVSYPCVLKGGSQRILQPLPLTTDLEAGSLDAWPKAGGALSQERLMGVSTVSSCGVGIGRQAGSSTQATYSDDIREDMGPTSLAFCKACF